MDSLLLYIMEKSLCLAKIHREKNRPGKELRSLVIFIEAADLWDDDWKPQLRKFDD